MNSTDQLKAHLNALDISLRGFNAAFSAVCATALEIHRIHWDCMNGEAYDRATARNITTRYPWRVDHA